ncbi:unnamed protein product, partial [Prorocentrum cordatum]
APDAPSEASPEAGAAQAAAPAVPSGEAAAAPPRRRVALRVALRGADLSRSFSKLGRLETRWTRTRSWSLAGRRCTAPRPRAARTRSPPGTWISPSPGRGRGTSRS